MACSYSNCGSYCTSNGCPTDVHRAARSGNQSGYSFPDLTKGVDVPSADYTNNLKNALNAEIDERNRRRKYGLTNVTFTNVSKGSNFVARSSNEVLVELKNKLNAIITNSKYSAAIGSGGDALSSTSVISDVYTVGEKYSPTHWTNIRDRILSLMRECLCNGDCGSNSWCSCYGDCGCNYSDANLKENVIEDGISLEKFNEVKSKSWNYVFDKEHKHFGPIAQDVEKAFPEAVREDAEGYKMLDQISMVGILWGALNKSIDKISELESRLETLEKK